MRAEKHLLDLTAFGLLVTSARTISEKWCVTVVWGEVRWKENGTSAVKNFKEFCWEGEQRVRANTGPNLVCTLQLLRRFKKVPKPRPLSRPIKTDLRELAASAEIFYSSQVIVIHNPDWQSPGWKEMWGWRYIQIYFKDCRDSNMLYCWWERSGWEGREGLVDCVKPWAVVVRKALEGSPLEGMHYTFNCIMITLTLKNPFNLRFFNYPE